MKFRAAFFCLLATGCSQAPETAAPVENIQFEPINEFGPYPAAAAAAAAVTPDASGPRTSSVETGTPVVVPSDPRASYWIMSQDQMLNGHLQVVTRRSGPSGESFARREIDCDTGTVRYLGEGDTLAQAQAESANVGEMTVPIAESITGVVTATACDS